MNSLETGFADDDGTADPGLRAALADFATSATHMSAAVLLDALTRARLLVPVAAVADSVTDEVVAVEKDSHMRAVEFHASDGRTAVLAFTGTDSLALWDRAARPIPRQAHIVAQSVLQADHDALILDIAGPHRVAVSDALLVRLALSADPERYLSAALEAACDELEGLPGVAQADWEMDESEAHIVLKLEHAPSDLGEQVSVVLQSPDLAVVLDRPLVVRVEDLGAAGTVG